MRTVTWLDVMLLALVALSVIGGYRRGAVLQVIGLVGLAVGVLLGALLAPRLASLGHDPMTHLALVMAAIVVGGAAGNLAGWLAGSRLREHTHGTSFRRVDSVLGSVVSVIALLAVTWFLTLNLANGPFPQVARGIRDSRIVQGLDAVMPAPPSLLGEAQHLMSLLGFPDVFVGLPPVPADPVAPPPSSLANRAFRTAEPSTFEVLGDGCYVGYLNQGSGFVVAHAYVLTNAHVVAGTSRQWIHNGTTDYQATVVAFDAQRDLALLHVPDLDAPALRFSRKTVGRGAGGAVLGYPAGGPLEGDPAAVRQVLSPVGRDIYGHGEVTRQLYEVQATIRHGNSGGPFVLPSGKVAGVVFASSVVDDAVGYAITSTDVIPFVRGATGGQLPVRTGSCTN
jgi:S1-C subfamily serine protease